MARRGRQFIGRLIGLYCEGRAHARIDNKRRRAGHENPDDRSIYLLGWTDEQARLVEAAKVAQVGMFDNVAETGRE